ncbi:MAG: DUF1552 domain-containing protein [Myxococcales bacterium]|nr:DUF1552 domain-containing protein [Myxococcales bacterium]
MRGAGSVAIALPVLEAMLDERGLLLGQAHALAAAEPPRRMVLFHFPNGVPMDDWTPTTEGVGWPLPPALEALAPWQDQINVLTGLGNGFTSVLEGNKHDITAPSHFTCVEPLGAGGQYTSAGGISCDQVAASQIGVGTKIPALQVSLFASHDAQPIVNRMSYAGVDQPSNFYQDPKTLFDALFLGLDVDPAEADALTDRRRSVLDHVQASTADLQSRLGAGDRQRLEQHLDALRELELSIGALPSEQCTLPADPGAVGAFDADIEARVEALLGLSAMAIRCDLTRVLMFSMGCSSCPMTYTFLGFSERDHALSHWPSGGTREDNTTMARWKVSRFARLLELLDAMPEGEGTMLDHTVLSCTSEIANGTNHDDEILPVLVAGRVGGMTGGRHLVYPCSHASTRHPATAAYCGGGQTPLANLWLTMMQAVGADVGSFAGSTGPLEGLWI